jgi:hypothetical protein
MTESSEALPTPGGEGSHPTPDGDSTRATALVEQAKSVLVFRYGIDAEAALARLEGWAGETGSTTASVAHAVVHDVFQDDQRQNVDPHLVRRLEDRLRDELPDVQGDLAKARTSAEPVTVAVGHSKASLDSVAEAARRANALGVPLELRMTVSSSKRGGADALERAHLMQRADLAVELARSVSPGLEVRLAPDDPLRTGRC